MSAAPAPAPSLPPAGAPAASPDQAPITPPVPPPTRFTHILAPPSPFEQDELQQPFAPPPPAPGHPEYAASARVVRPPFQSATISGACHHCTPFRGWCIIKSVHALWGPCHILAPPSPLEQDDLQQPFAPPPGPALGEYAASARVVRPAFQPCYHRRCPSSLLAVWGLLHSKLVARPVVAL